MEFILFVFVLVLAFAPFAVLVFGPDLRQDKTVESVRQRPARRSRRPRFHRGPGGHAPVPG